jgi:hypothetical protein
MSETGRLTFERLLEGEVNQTSLINELPPVPPRESATARAIRRWFKQNPTVENEPAG